MTIRFGLGICSLGAILIATSDRGVCAILLDRDPAALVSSLKECFPEAHLEVVDTGMTKSMLSKAVALVEHPGVDQDLPLDMRGTPFQLRVWQALREIPAGTTISYTELAQRIGSPKSVRAVATACAANTLAVAVPCHRVIRADGELSGYRWGVERRRALLKREARETGKTFRQQA